MKNLVLLLLFIVSFGYSQNDIVNLTDQPFLTEIIEIGLDEMNITSATVIIKELKSKPKSVSTRYGTYNETFAFIRSSYLRKDQGKFVIYIQKLREKTAIKILSHELIHLNQYYTRNLMVSGQRVIFDGKYYKHVTNEDYKYRAWEIEANRLSLDLFVKIMKKYKK